MLNRLRRPTAIALAFALFNTAACYTYAPLATGASPKVGERVRLRLTADGMNELARYLGPRVSQAEGTLVSFSPDVGYVVGVDFVQTADGIRQPWSGEGQVTFPPQYVVDLKQHTFLKKQTIITTTLAVVGLVILAKVALNSGLLGDDGGSGTVVNP